MTLADIYYIPVKHQTNHSVTGTISEVVNRVHHVAAEATALRQLELMAVQESTEHRLS